MKYVLSFSVTLLAVLLHVGAAQAKCVEVALIDDGGQLIIPNGLVVGMLVGDSPVFDIALPPHREQKLVRDVACSPGLKNTVTDLYNRSCTSDTARQQAVVSNQTTLDVVVKGCADMRAALRTAK